MYVNSLVRKVIRLSEVTCSLKVPSVSNAMYYSIKMWSTVSRLVIIRLQHACMILHNTTMQFLII